MIYVEAPGTWEENPYSGNLSIFLAGGITNCPDWQQEVVKGLEDADLIVYNPRRKNFPMDDKNAAEEQIRWEHEHIKKASIILFWFSRGSYNPIVMFEYGKELGRGNKGLLVGVDPEYVRADDVRIQTTLERPDIMVYQDLDSLIKRAWPEDLRGE